MKRWLAPIAIAMMAGATTAWSQDLPDGWRLRTRKEVSDVERSDSSTRLANVVADFNGDGVIDEALLLKNKRYSAEALWVRLSMGDKGFRWLKLDEIKWGRDYPNVDLVMGVDVADPGVYPYGCFHGAKDCFFGHVSDRPKPKLRDPSIAYFKLGSASSTFFWSYKHQRFLRVWTSD